MRDGTPAQSSGTTGPGRSNGTAQAASTIFWIDDTDDWTTAADWSSGAVPGPGAAVAVNNGAPQITSDAGTIASLTVGSNGEVDESDGGRLSVANAVSNAGRILVDYFSGQSGSQLSIGGTLTNTSLVQVGSTSQRSAETLTAGALVNTGNIAIFGSSAASASLVVTGATSNTAEIDLGAFGSMTTKSYAEGSAAVLNLEVGGRASGRFATMASAGAVTLAGGALVVRFNDGVLAFGQSYDLVTFASRQLAGVFSRLTVFAFDGTSGGSAPTGTSVDLGNGLTAGLFYGNAAGRLTLQIVATPTTTGDTFVAASGDWWNPSNWSSGRSPIFYSDVTIGAVPSAAVTLGTDATMTSLALRSGSTLSTYSNNTITVGGAVTVGAGTSLTTGMLFANGTLTNTGRLFEIGALVTASGIANQTNAAFTIVGDGGVGLMADSSATFNNAGGTLAKTSGSGTSVVAMSLKDTSSTAARIQVASGTLRFAGTTNSFVAQTVTGNGTFAIGAGVSTIGIGTTIATGGFAISGTGTAVTVAENLTYAGQFSEAAGALVGVARSDTLSLTGTASLAGTVNGGGTLALSGITSLAKLSVGVSLQVQNTASGTVTQSARVALGDSSTSTAAIVNKGSWRLAGDVEIAAGSPSARFDNAGGSLVKTAGAGLALVGVAMTNSGAAAGTVEVATGSLQLEAVSGKQAFLIDAGTTLIFDQSVASGSAVTFGGSTGTLLLPDAQDFHGSISNLQGSTTIDLRSVAFNGASASPSYAGSPSSGTLTVTDGSHTANLTLLGNYTGGNFHVAADNHGGTAITFV